MSQHYTEADPGVGAADGESMASYHEARPAFYIGQHDSARTETLTDMQYGQVLNSGVGDVETPADHRPCCSCANVNLSSASLPPQSQTIIFTSVLCVSSRKACPL